MYTLFTQKRFLAVFLAVFVGTIANAVPFQQIIDDDAGLIFTIRNLTELREQWSEHPIEGIFKDESLREWFRLQSDLKDVADDESKTFFEDIEDTFGLSEDDFFELFPGQAGLAVYNLSGQILGNEEQVEFLGMAEFSGDEEQLQELMQIQFEHNAKMQKEVNPLIEHDWVEETFMGETLHFDEIFDGEKTYVEDGYALVDGILVLATPESRLRHAVEMIKNGPEAPLSDLEPYRRSRDYSGRGDVALYVNLIKLMPRLNAKLGELPISGSFALFGITPQSLESALSLESLEGVFLDLDLIDEGILGYCGILYSEKSGILSMLNYVEGDLPEARYVPDNILNGSVTLFDISAMYRSLEKILGAASPQIVSMLDIQMQTAQTNTGVDLRASLLENFGTQIVGFSVLKEDAKNASDLMQPQQVVVFDLKDAEAFGQALNALIDSAQFVRPMIKENTFEGETIYSIVTPGQTPETEVEIHYTVTRSKFILTVGHIGLLHTVLSDMKNDSDGFWQKPDVLALFERIEQPNAVSRGYYDMEQLITSLFELLADMNHFRGNSESLQSEAIPESLKGAYRLVLEANEAPDGLFARVLIVKDESK